jgi:hypothetical protein
VENPVHGLRFTVIDTALSVFVYPVWGKRINKLPIHGLGIAPLREIGKRGFRSNFTPRSRGLQIENGTDKVSPNSSPKVTPDEQ